MPTHLVHLSGTRALVVDDDPDAAYALANLLRTTLAWRVRIANSGSEALSLLEPFRPQIAFLDILMPEMNGLELARALRQSGQFGDIPIIAASGLDSEEIEADVKAAGFDARLVKPVVVETLAAALQRLHLAPPPDRLSAPGIPEPA